MYYRGGRRSVLLRSSVITAITLLCRWNKKVIPDPQGMPVITVVSLHISAVCSAQMNWLLAGANSRSGRWQS